MSVIKFKLDNKNAGAKTDIRNKSRATTDAVFRVFMAIGGVSVIGTILLIFFYLAYVVIPLFGPAKIDFSTGYNIDERGKILAKSLDEYSEIIFSAHENGDLVFSSLRDKKEITSESLQGKKRSNERITAVSVSDPASRVMVIGTGNGSVYLVQTEYEITYPNDVRLISPSILYPVGKVPLEVDKLKSAILKISGQFSDGNGVIASLTDDNRLLMTYVQAESSFFSDEVEISYKTIEIAKITVPVSSLELDVNQRSLALVNSDGVLSMYDVASINSIELVDRVSVVRGNESVTDIKFLSSGISLIIGSSAGHISQWSAVRDVNNIYSLKKIRVFDSMPASIRSIAPEHYRKGFGVLDANRNLSIYHATANKRVAFIDNVGLNPRDITICPRSKNLLITDNDTGLGLYTIKNEHPEISLNALLGKVWYESREGPEYIWQSSAANSDFEPKYSLVPLVFGTIKATLYSLLFAAPLAIFGAVYTAYFMAPKMRRVVKPTIEIMEALPTVILGFLAGLWFAPFVEKNLAGFFLSILAIPSSTIIMALIWPRTPRVLKKAFPEGWESLLLIPVISLAIWGALSLGTQIEARLFDGNLPHWLNINYGIGYDQRNSLIVGIAIGFAVIPTIFSISEDAVYGVPRSLTNGSLALGATPWQTVYRVILLTASPGIFSACMIGMGRAVGETMIVLMATGNTPIMNLNIFEGFRALSANIAVEMPESAVNSTHYRILFLAAFFLFLVTFAVNTISEIVRQRLRAKYANL